MLAVAKPFEDKKSTISYNDGDDYTTMMRHDVLIVRKIENVMSRSHGWDLPRSQK